MVITVKRNCKYDTMKLYLKNENKNMGFEKFVQLTLALKNEPCRFLTLLNKLIKIFNFSSSPI